MEVYNRYVRNDQGAYTRIAEEPPVPPPKEEVPPPPREPQGEKKPFSFQQTTDGLASFLRSLLDRAHLQDIDTGDLLLLGLLYFLFKEDADEELLFALGLLLIL